MVFETLIGFIIGLGVLSFSSDKVVENSIKVAKSLGVSPLIIGLFIALLWNYLPILLGEVAEQFTLSYHLESLFNRVFDQISSTDAVISLVFIGGLTLMCVLGSMFSFKMQEIL